MEHSELIHRFIDEGLDPIAEQNLFENMAKNPALRSEFKQYLAFERAALTDFSAYQPSLNSTNTIFSTLGISPTAAGTTPTINSPISFWAKYGGIILTNIASIIITAALLYFFNLQGDDKSNLSKSNPNLKSQTIEQNSVPVVSNFDNDTKTKTNSKIPEKVKYIYIEKPEKEPTHTELNQPTSFEPNTIGSSEVSIINSTNFIKQTLDNPLFQNQNLPNENKFIKIDDIQLIPMDYAIKNLGLENVSIMFAGNDSYSLPQSPLPRSSQPLFDSKSLVLLYDLSSSISLGLDLRQEFYYLDYTGQVGAKEYRYEQNTNFTSIGIVGKFNWLNYQNFKSFANLYIGGNKIGQIGRIMIGTEISPSKEYGFIIGVEGSLLRHLHQNKEFWAKKIGLNYGIMFHF